MVRLLDVSYLVYVLQCNYTSYFVTWWNEEMMDAVKTVMLLPGLLAPFSIPAAALRKYEVGGDEIVNENVLSGCRIPKHEHNAVVPANTLILIVNLTGIGIPAL